MKAIVYEAFSAPPQLKSVPDPTPEAHGVAIKGQAAIDISDEKLAVARGMGAIATVNATQVANVVEAVTNITKGGVHVSLDALGHPSTCLNSISNLRRRGKHIQVGLMLAENSTPAIPMAKVIAHELEILRSYGMQAHRYGAMLDMVQTGKLTPEKNLSARGSIWSNRLMR
jgi:alcohol dehydrogenase